jgi:hypothetical protein
MVMRSSPDARDADSVGASAARRRQISTALLSCFLMIGPREESSPEDWTDSLRATFSIARTAGFSCFGGWKSVVVRLLERLSLLVQELPSDERRAFKVVEIRQKFGALTVYLSGGPTPAMWAAIGEASEAAMVTCEVCGAPGAPADRHGWTSVRCEAHENWSRFDRMGA